MVKPTRGNQGFTLVELLLVVAILALISLLAVPKVHGAMMDVRHAQMLKEIRTIQDSLDRYYADHHQYPRRLGFLVDHGYMRPGTTFKSPVSGKYYFYAVDDNRDNRKPQAYALGDVGKHHRKTSDRRLEPTGLFPAPRDPNVRAYAWLDNTGATLLTLTLEGGRFLDPDEYPANLAMYRASCNGTAPPPCDLWTN